MLPGDLYYCILATHPTDPAIIFTVAANGDLARWDGNTGTWKTNYGIRPCTRPRIRRAGGIVASIALDPQDANVGYVSWRVLATTASGDRKTFRR